MSVELSRAEHRAIEAWLDRLAADGSRESFAAAWRLLAAHYAREERELFALHPGAFTAKLIAQHDEVRELAGHLETAGEDWPQLARRFLAIAQHNIIEEERDFFPLFPCT